jgi:hypothetical protein
MFKKCSGMVSSLLLLCLALVAHAMVASPTRYVLSVDSYACNVIESSMHVTWAGLDQVTCICCQWIRSGSRASTSDCHVCIICLVRMVAALVSVRAPTPCPPFVSFHHTLSRTRWVKMSPDLPGVGSPHCQLHLRAQVSHRRFLADQAHSVADVLPVQNRCAVALSL